MDTQAASAWATEPFLLTSDAQIAALTRLLHDPAFATATPVEVENYYDKFARCLGLNSRFLAEVDPVRKQLLSDLFALMAYDAASDFAGYTAIDILWDRARALLDSAAAIEVLSFNLDDRTRALAQELAAADGTNMDTLLGLLVRREHSRRFA